MTLPIFQDSNPHFTMMQTSWAGTLNPFLSNPFLNGILLPNVALVSGTNVVNHKLGRMPQGFVIYSPNAGVLVYQNANPTNLVLNLSASGTVTLGLYVF